MKPTNRHTVAFYHLTPGTAHAPVNSHAIIVTITYTTPAYGVQICFCGYGTYRRTLNGQDGWKDWMKITD